MAPAVRLLDKIYATRVTLEDLSSKYGYQPLEWPLHVVEQLRDRNTAILGAIEGSICALPSGLYFPLGESSCPVPLLRRSAIQLLISQQTGAHFQPAVVSAAGRYFTAAM